MQAWSFKSIVLCNEINLNVIGSHFGINSKLKWEDPLILSESSLDGIIKEPQNKYVYIYHFGALVCINMAFHEIQDLIKYLKEIDSSLKNNTPSEFIDEYKLEIDSSYKFAMYNDYMTTNELLPYYVDIISLVLAKSTSLRKIEIDIDKLLDQIEDIINYLDTGKFNVSDRQIAKTSAKILRFKYNTISYLMLLDKPRSAWDDEDIENFFSKMISLFEIRDRYDKISHKTEILQDITEVFSSLTYEKRGVRLDLWVIILFAIEILFSVFQFLIQAKH